jgi:tetratricopeptide (TPR) repeat protein
MKKEINIDEQNQDAYDDLIVSIEAGVGKLNLLIAVCDYPDFREEIIARYEKELKPNFGCYRTTLRQQEPSLKNAIYQLTQQEKHLQQHPPTVITVTGAEKLFFLKFDEEQSQQEKFFGYLQWTREGMRDYPFSIVLWLNNNLLQNLIKKSPDFWSWRAGVFRFVSHQKNTVSPRDIENFRHFISDINLEKADDDNQYFLPIEDLQRLIQQIESQQIESQQVSNHATNPVTNPVTLASLYTQLGQIYRRRLENGEAQNFQEELALAIQYFQKAIKLQEKLDLELELATSLNNLALLYNSQGKYEAAEPLYQQALELRKRILGENHPEYANSLNNLAGLYDSQGKYEAAEPLYQQGLELTKRILGENHPQYATSLNNLASLYYSQGKYEAAEPLYQQALELTKRILGENHPQYATSLNNLALLYNFQGKYEAAEPLYQQALELTKRILGENHPEYATSLNNLALLYDSQGKYEAAEPLLQQALELRKRILGENHPQYATSLNNLAGLYDSQGKYEAAEPLYQQALELTKRILGENHPNTLTVKKNLESLPLQQ